MGLDIEFRRQKKVTCPQCHCLVKYEESDVAYSQGRAWYPFLEQIGYYVPHDQITEENNWYGKDKILIDKQVKDAYKFVRTHEVYCGRDVAWLLMLAMAEDDDVIVNANW